MISLRRLYGGRSKKAWVITGSILFILLVSGYILWSRQLWAEYTPRHMQWQQDIKAEVAKAIVLPSTNDKQREELQTQIESTARRISIEQKNICKIPVIVSWQQRLIAQYKDMQVACQREVTNIVLFQERLDSVIVYLKDDQALAKISASIAPPGAIADTAWGRQIDEWGRATADVKRMHVSPAFRPTQLVAIDRMTTVKLAWQELIVAHQQKDKAKYAAAQNQLGVSYDGLNAITLSDNKSLTSLIGAVSEAYVKAFD